MGEGISFTIKNKAHYLEAKLLVASIVRNTNQKSGVSGLGDWLNGRVLEYHMHHAQCPGLGLYERPSSVCFRNSTETCSRTQGRVQSFPRALPQVTGAADVSLVGGRIVIKMGEEFLN